MDALRRVDPEIDDAIQKELQRQHEHLELIASENFTSPAVLEAQGSVLTNKYAEGYPGARWYGGCEFVDVAERLAIDRVKALFGAEHANVQPHSGTEANIAVFYATLQAGDAILAMSLAHGGHLSHGHPKNFSGKYFTIIPYGVNKTTEQLEYDELDALAREHKPKMILAGYSAYPRVLDFARFRQIADAVGALLLVDMAHFAGLAAAGVYPNPTPHADLVTSTTHKTLRGPRGGFILCKAAHAKAIDSAVFPGIQGGPLMHVVAAKAVCFKEASTDAFKAYARQIVANAQALAAAMSQRGYRIVSGGTDNHLLLVDLTPKHLTGKEAQETLDQARITVNKNAIPFDPLPPLKASGIRLGTPAVTTRGMREGEMIRIAQLIDEALAHRVEAQALARVREQVHDLVEQFPLYPELRR
ncbi:MAG TPA: serine hydroxymethyltransferase [Candidatus Omnitrophica bacterium]|nr:MAG: serine hydroxymethyltransferase [Omnitrophica WOR_2 bacterium GWA2_63_20]OGX15448.1 MAG: serine hydroxymethyltransferase [Omnitrophica WOR_2 bacterium GWF2_63_9]OGX32842.1 MAG: serine hydroxymethyltransferase [Omnitrophica WOR_2 bacterium RIFCSPHIGHO2_12_FULL_64_13]OGX35603.1 MAG: serine hydroxymethyltransferase [Omnitrophica WOR_2 bacterium RIFCSPHIGHO2_02_FULL_63_39]OGX46313.1 MAG: serine hydroxymethyltransferase [Omnitrophica WOR_2 bacterium RIFCSPLOWO2_02_FULL_63_16]OGX47092.1 MAG: